MEAEEFSAQCDKNLSDGSFDENDDERASRREGVGILLTKFHVYSLLPTELNKLRTIISGKSVHSPVRIVWVLYTFLQTFDRYNFLLIITLHGQKFFGKMGEKAITILGTQKG